MKIEKALVVDDSKVAHLALNKLLRERGIEVDWAGSGEDGLDYLRQRQSSVVFMDVMMPGMDGFETVLAINRDAQACKPPIIMCSANATDEDKALAAKNGAVGFLSKPYTPDELDQVLDMVRQKEEPAPAEVMAVETEGGEDELFVDEIGEPGEALIPEPMTAEPQPVAPPSAEAQPGLSSREISDIARKVATQAAQSATEKTAREVATEVVQRLLGEASKKVSQEAQGAAVSAARNVAMQGLQQALKKVSQRQQELEEAQRKELTRSEQQVLHQVKQMLGGAEFRKQVADLVKETAGPAVEPIARKIAEQVARQVAEQAAQASAQQVAEAAARPVAEEVAAGAAKGASGRANIALVLALLALAAAVALQFIELPL